MKQASFIFTFLLIIYLSNTQALLAQSSEQALQEMAQEIISDIKNPEQNPGLLTGIRDIIRPHSNFLFNTLPEMQTDPEFEPYIEEYEALKGQYMGNGQPISINPNIRILLGTGFPRQLNYDESLEDFGLCFSSGLIIIDRGFWEYHQDNDEIRQVVVIHELGHCDLKQEHGDNAIMNIAWEDDLLNSRTIDWPSSMKSFL